MSVLDTFVRSVLGCPECGGYATHADVSSSSAHRHEARVCARGHRWVIARQKQADGTWHRVTAGVNEDGS